MSPLRGSYRLRSFQRSWLRSHHPDVRQRARSPPLPRALPNPPGQTSLLTLTPSPRTPRSNLGPRPSTRKTCQAPKLLNSFSFSHIDVALIPPQPAIIKSVEKITSPGHPPGLFICAAKSMIFKTHSRKPFVFKNLRIISLQTSQSREHKY